MIIADELGRIHDSTMVSGQGSEDDELIEALAISLSLTSLDSGARRKAPPPLPPFVVAGPPQEPRPLPPDESPPLRLRPEVRPPYFSHPRVTPGIVRRFLHRNNVPPLNVPVVVHVFGPLFPKVLPIFRRTARVIRLRSDVVELSSWKISKPILTPAIHGATLRLAFPPLRVTIILIAILEIKGSLGHCRRRGYGFTWGNVSNRSLICDKGVDMQTW